MPYPRPDKEDVAAYLAAMSEHEKTAMRIAQSQLGSSFNVEKSIGFVQWLSQKDSEQ